MRKYFSAAFVALFALFFTACVKEHSFPQAGGDVPAEYILLKPTVAGAALDTVASGAMLRFVNNDTKPHNLRSTDSVSIRTNIIAPNSFYELNTSGLAGVYAYQCILDTAIRGSIIVTP
ncbi:MAG: hypothetical protein EOO03_03325 [Chitinophagaceae bacterium]|nr:MAG: hypothetical protein EOO03_03325 [Chitinophagaceae bacterium]